MLDSLRLGRGAGPSRCSRTELKVQALFLCRTNGHVGLLRAVNSELSTMAVVNPVIWPDAKHDRIWS
jgi:hypothetical protein